MLPDNFPSRQFDSEPPRPDVVVERNISAVSTLVPARYGTVAPHITHGQSLFIAGLAYFALIGVAAILGAILTGSISVPHAVLPWLAALSVPGTLLVAWLTHGLKTGDWTFPEAVQAPAVPGEAMFPVTPTTFTPFNFNTMREGANKHGY